MISRVFLIGVVVLVVSAVDICAQEPRTVTGHSIDDVAWLAGCWEMSKANLSVEESWMPPRGGTMLGMSRTVQAERTTGYELVMIREIDSGLRYEAHPSGQAPATFEATWVSTGGATFENPQHDFPRRIRYERIGSDSLLAEIDDGAGGGTIRFLYGRTPCGG